MEDEILICDVTDGIARLVMNRPAKLNALSDAMLTAPLTALRDDQDVRVTILTGAGKAFRAGHDLKEMQTGHAAPDGGAAYFNDLFARCGALMQLIPSSPQPVIAEVHAIATAAGCQLRHSCCRRWHALWRKRRQYHAQSGV
ncbi:putative enoyl-CoA hydratase echA8 [Roseibaca ekhonensis]|jgi:enoyl-CoA hydratase/carnithine racemase|uniref:Putative enoyl-CoA hydratase echA8 n=1 Tax=Roseinatronobacter ekhonensis TaxID=254356 RepID=A0A3B0MRA8_9RHOB|nr:putative enoyl-CoA hydratase echA8 [Roseibaca ekhonensis]